MFRFVTAASLFDGHDAAINLYRRLFIKHGFEVIHLGHNRSVADVVQAAIEENADAIAISSYQGGHVEYFKYLVEKLKDHGAEDIALFGGGGGVITAEEIILLEKEGVDRIYTPKDGLSLGLDGIIDDIKSKIKARKQSKSIIEGKFSSLRKLSKQISLYGEKPTDIPLDKISIPVIGLTGTGGAGKSSLIDELVLRYQMDFPEHRILILTSDPVKKVTQGSLLGDRIRMNAIYKPNIFLRSFAVSEEERGIHPGIKGVIAGLALDKVPFDLIILESSGIGQADTTMTQFAHKTCYVMTPEFGAESQLEKISMLDVADLIVVNKLDRQGADDAVDQVRRTYRRYRNDPKKAQERVCGACAARYQDPNTHEVYRQVLNLVSEVHQENNKPGLKSQNFKDHKQVSEMSHLVPRHRVQYLAEISESVRAYHREAQKTVKNLKKIDALQALEADLPKKEVEALRNKVASSIPQEALETLKVFDKLSKDYESDQVKFQVRDKPVIRDTKSTSLSGLKVPKIARPPFTDLNQKYEFCAKENYPGFFPYTGGVFPFKRTEEHPKRMFAGEGGPEKTNKRFHYLCKGEKAKRLSTAFDSVTLYGADPDERPDIFGKIGESGVSIATLDDMKVLYRDFDLCDPFTSVSMTINGPAPMILAFFFNTALDQQLDKFENEKGRKPNDKEIVVIRSRVFSTVRGTVQADILKEDQAQNTCIFSLEFALRMMGDIQQYFIDHKVRNFYSVSVSGYHIAEAGANPITQLAFTLANGLTYVELYRSRGMDVSQFAPSLSFFFSNGLDPEYSVIGRVARRIWAIAMRDYYKGSERSQKLKYHIQTSGRSLHAQEIEFNDIRTTLQALLALADNCNSLHTNAFDEALTTPTEASVRQAMAIQLVAAQEFGLLKNENPWQGSYFLEWLTDVVEEAVLREFDRISDRGGVLSAMEFQYQRNKIQQDSYHYEQQKHNGDIPVMGVNTYLAPEKEQGKHDAPVKLSRSTYEEKQDQIKRLRAFQKRNDQAAPEAIVRLKQAALDSKANLFEVLLDVSRVLSLGQMSSVLYGCGGEYRRAM
jgi:isobutyryl-CoA mutase